MSKDLKVVFHFWKRFARQNGLNRRDLIKGIATASLGLVAGTFGAPQIYRAAGLRCVVYLQCGYAQARPEITAHERLHLRGP